MLVLHIGLLGFFSSGVRSISRAALGKQLSVVRFGISNVSYSKLNAAPVQVAAKSTSIDGLSKFRPKEANVNNSSASAFKPTILQSPEIVYFLREELDSSAEPVADLGKELIKILPVLSGTVIIEFWITEAGQATRIDFIKGQTLLPLDEAMQILLSYEFTPALRDGKPVASRKLIEIDTDAILQTSF